MKSFVFTVLSVAGLAVLSLPAAETSSAYRVDFSSPAVKQAVRRCPYARIEKDLEHTDVLIVEVPESAGNSVSAMVDIPVNLAKNGMAGKMIYGEAYLENENVKKPTKSYLGIKFMLPYNSPSQGRSYPEFLTPKQKYGTAPWRKLGSMIQIPSDVRLGHLTLGLQNTTGKVSFKNICLYPGSAMPRSIFTMKEVPRAVYTVNPPRQQGAMCPAKPVEKNFADLKKMGGNSMRWIANVNAKEATLPAIRTAMERHLANLDQALELAEKYGIMLTIDLHANRNSGAVLLGTPAGRDAVVDFWKRAAAKCRGKSAVFGYDLLNEPHTSCLKHDDPLLAAQYDRIIREIRAIDPVTPIIVESDYMSHPDTLQYLPVFPYENIIYSVHVYAPMELTHQLNPKLASYNGYPDAARKWEKEYLRKFLVPVKKFQEKTGARIYIGEFGCIRWAPGADRWLRDCIELFEEYGWDWAYHAFREWQGWSVEHSDDPGNMAPVEMTARKQAILDGFKRNQEKEK